MKDGNLQTQSPSNPVGSIRQVGPEDAHPDPTHHGNRRTRHTHRHRRDPTPRRIRPHPARTNPVRPSRRDLPVGDGPPSRTADRPTRTRVRPPSPESTASAPSPTAHLHCRPRSTKPRSAAPARDPERKYGAARITGARWLTVRGSSSPVERVPPCCRLAQGSGVGSFERPQLPG
jgi:hypothetical protein